VTKCALFTDEKNVYCKRKIQPSKCRVYVYNSREVAEKNLRIEKENHPVPVMVW